MRCPKCQSPLPEKAKFCLECGSRISGISKQSGAEGADLGSVVLSSHVTRVGREEVAAAGQVVGERYELLEEIGRGGFGVVWRARDRKLDRTVALKRLHGQSSGGEEAGRVVERFQREARIIATMNHRNVVQVFDHDRDGEGHYLVMELVEGGSLKEHLKERGKLPLAEALALVRGIGQGLMHGHRKNLVHRDLKPANVLLQRDGGEIVPKIVDFGLARAGEGSEQSISGYGMGTPFYMPPEQRRNAKGVNHTADIYALGKVFYEMLTGSVPDQVDPEKVPEGVAKVIFRCVKERPEERYFSVEELLQDVEALGGGAALAGRRGSGGGVACPQCQAPNPEGERFCGRCGAGLTRVCPECGRENSVHRKYCGGCGTEVDAFVALQNTQGKMAQYRGEKKWSRVIKEAGIAATGGKLPGKKGQETLGAIRAMRKEAEERLRETDAMRRMLGEALKAKWWGKALGLVESLQALGPEAGDHGDLRLKLEGKADEEAWATAVRGAAEGSPDLAIAAYEGYLRRLPEGKNSAAALEAVAEKRRVRRQAACTQARGLVEKRRHQEAVTLLEEAAKLDGIDTELMSMLEKEQKVVAQLQKLSERLWELRAMESPRECLETVEQILALEPGHRGALARREQVLRMSRRREWEISLKMTVLIVGAFIIVGGLVGGFYCFGGDFLFGLGAVAALLVPMSGVLMIVDHPVVGLVVSVGMGVSLFLAALASKHRIGVEPLPLLYGVCVVLVGAWARWWWRHVWSRRWWHSA